VADERKVVFTGFGPSGGPTNSEILVNSFTWGLDNRIHGGCAGIGGVIASVSAPSQAPLTLGRHDFSFDPRQMTISAETGSAQTGLTFDNRGRKFFCDLTHPLRSTFYDLHYYSRNPWVRDRLNHWTSWPRAHASFASWARNRGQLRRAARRAHHALRVPRTRSLSPP